VTYRTPLKVSVQIREFLINHRERGPCLSNGDLLTRDNMLYRLVYSAFRRTWGWGWG